MCSLLMYAGRLTIVFVIYCGILFSNCWEEEQYKSIYVTIITYLFIFIYLFVCLWFVFYCRPGPTAQVANTRPTGHIRPSTLFYLAWHLVSTQQQCRAPCP